MERTDFDRIGETRLRDAITDFVARVRRDVMIGFHFRDVDPVRLAELEYQHAAAHLGGAVVYEGRALRAAHTPHKIMGGQFARRREILKQTLAAHSVEPDVIARWLAHVDTLRGEITADPASECR